MATSKANRPRLLQSELRHPSAALLAQAAHASPDEGPGPPSPSPAVTNNGWTEVVKKNDDDGLVEPPWTSPFRENDDDGLAGD